MAEEEKRFHEKLADRLIEAREAAGITQEKLAEKVGLQSNSIHRYEAAERKMNFFTAVKVADALNTTVERLIPEEYIPVPGFILRTRSSISCRRAHMRNPSAYRPVVHQIRWSAPSSTAIRCWHL